MKTKVAVKSNKEVFILCWCSVRYTNPIVLIAILIQKTVSGSAAVCNFICYL